MLSLFVSITVTNVAFSVARTVHFLVLVFRGQISSYFSFFSFFFSRFLGKNSYASDKLSSFSLFCLPSLPRHFLRLQYYHFSWRSSFTAESLELFCVDCQIACCTPAKSVACSMVGILSFMVLLFSVLSTFLEDRFDDMCTFPKPLSCVSHCTSLFRGARCLLLCFTLCFGVCALVRLYVVSVWCLFVVKGT